MGSLWAPYGVAIPPSPRRVTYVYYEQYVTVVAEGLWGPYGSLWVPMGLYGSLYIPMGLFGSLWVPMGRYVSLWVPMGRYGALWGSRCGSGGDDDEGDAVGPTAAQETERLREVGGRRCGAQQQQHR